MFLTIFENIFKMYIWTYLFFAETGASDDLVK